MNDTRVAKASPAKSAIWTGIAIYLNSGLLLLATPVFTRLMTPSEYGEVALYNSLVIVFGALATLSLSTSILNNAILEWESDLDRFIAAMIGLTTVSTLVSGLLLYVVTKLAGNVTGVRQHLFGFMFVNFVLNSAYLVWRTRERAFFRYRAVAAVSIITSLVGIGGALYLMSMERFSGYLVELRVIVAALPLALAGAFLYVRMLCRGRAFYDAGYWRYTLLLAIPLLPHYLAQAGLLQIDKWLIERSLGVHEVGVYGLAAAIASGLTLFWTAISASWVPWMLRRLHHGIADSVSDRSVQLLVVVGALCVLGGVVAPEAVMLLAPASYKEAQNVVPVLLLASYFQFCQSLFLTVQFYRKRVMLITICSVLAAAVNVVLNILLIENHGIVAAAAVMVISQLIQLAIHYGYVRGSDEVEIVGPGSLFLISMATVLMSITAMMLADHLSLRMMIAVASLLLIGRHAFGMLNAKGGVT